MINFGKITKLNNINIWLANNEKKKLQNFLNLLTRFERQALEGKIKTYEDLEKVTHYLYRKITGIKRIEKFEEKELISELKNSRSYTLINDAKLQRWIESETKNIIDLLGRANQFYHHPNKGQQDPLRVFYMSLEVIKKIVTDEIGKINREIGDLRKA